MIPKIIWQTHNYTIENMPENVKNVCANWINLNPGWKYNYINHIEREEFVKKYPEILPYYLSLSPKLQSDIWRYLITYEYGGLYADMDAICIKPIDYMLESIDKDAELIVMPKELNHGITNNAMYLIKDHSFFMKSIIDRLHMIAKRPDAWNDEWFPFNLFVSSLEDIDNVYYEFTAARHSGDFHNIFPWDLEIDFYGKNVIYEKFVKENGLSLSI